METGLNDLEGLRIAMDIERRGYHFYEMAYEKFSAPEIKELFRELRDEEQEHLETFTRYFEEIEQTKDAYSTEYLFDPAYTSYLTVLAESHVFPKEEDAPAVFAHIKTPVDVLQLAMQAEKDSILFYGELADCSKFESARQAFRKLKEEEKRHAVELGKKIQQLQQENKA